MARSNKISAVFSDADKTSVVTKIDEIKTMMPFLISLTTNERIKSRKMGSKSVDYVRQCLEGAKAFPAELKQNFNTHEMERDYNLINNLLGAQVACQGLLELLNDTLMAGGVDAMEAADEVYASLKLSAKSNANVKLMVEKISQRFKGQGKTNNPTT
jgi:hypothetical protein